MHQFFAGRSFAVASRAGKPMTAPGQRLRWDLRLAALLALAATIVAGFSAHSLKAPEYRPVPWSLPTVLGHECAPGVVGLLSRVRGDAVHSQFVNISASPVTETDQESEIWTYESPLFKDDITTGE